ncbi:MAG: DUF1186 domain-containing protein [Methylococcaceae bacterium]|nr:DUF1186 domain-containing protein [Methylococcaceae bacterium]
MTFDEVLDRLESLEFIGFQKEALQEAIKIQKDFTPALLDIISFSAANPNYLVDNPDYMGFTYALYLLAQFKEKQAYPIIVKYVSQLNNDFSALDGTGDMVTEDLGSLLASVCNGDLSLIKQLIENPERNDFVRSAALESLVVLYKHDLLTRTELITYLKSLVDQKLERRESYIWTTLAHHCCNIHPEELHDRLMMCFDKGYINPENIDQADITRYLQQEKELTLEKLKADKRLQIITDVIKSMEWWACFQQEVAANTNYSYSSDLYAQDGDVFTPNKVRTDAKIGRNDPCLCGSGKKYKKCCLH